MEWSADKDDPIDSHTTWAKANPAFGYRLDVEKTEDDYNLMTEDGFSREKLGMWSSGSANSVFDIDVWDSLISTKVPNGPFALSIDVSSMMDRASVAVAAYNGEAIQVQVLENRRGTGWIADLVSDFQKNKRPFLGVFIDKQSAAASLLTELRAKRIKVMPIGTQDITQACGMFINRVNNGSLLHVDQAPLNDAIANARKRPVGDAFAWQKKNIDVDITPLVAVTNAAHGLTLKRRPKTETDETEETTTKRPANRALFF
jgi:phage terminase large subunit-like protein